MAKRSSTLFLLGLLLAVLCMASSAHASCLDQTTCSACVAEGCGWCSSTLKCQPGWIPGFLTGCNSFVKNETMCTPLRDSFVRLGDSYPAVSDKLVQAYDFLKEKLA